MMQLEKTIEKPIIKRIHKDIVSCKIIDINNIIESKDIKEHINKNCEETEDE